MEFIRHHRSYAALHSFATRRLGLNATNRAVYQIDNNFEVVKCFDKLSDVKAAGFSMGGVGACCSRKCARSGNYYWSYADEYTTDWTPVETAFLRNEEVFCRQTDTVYASPTDAAEQLNLSRSKIGRCCNNKEKHTGGYQFCWVKDLSDKVWEEIEYIEPRAYSETEISFLNTYIESKGIIWCAEQLGRSEGSVTQHVYRHLTVRPKATRKIAKNVKCVKCVETGQVFGSSNEAAVTFLNNPKLASSIAQTCKGARKSTGGYHWEYVD